MFATANPFQGVSSSARLILQRAATTQNIDYCSGQCWYDNFVVTPAGYPDIVYLGDSFDYGTYAFTSNGRGVLHSTDAGASFTDMTWDATTNPTPTGSCCQPNPISRMDSIQTNMHSSLAQVTRVCSSKDLTAVSCARAGLSQTSHPSARAHAG